MIIILIIIVIILIIIVILVIVIIVIMIIIEVAVVVVVITIIVIVIIIILKIMIILLVEVIVIVLTLWLCTGLCGGVWPDDVKDASGKLDPNMFFRTPCFGCQMQWINGFLNNSFRLLDYGDPQNPCYGRKFEGLYDHIQ